MTRLFFVIVLIWSTSIFGQATANFTASVTIIEPVSIVSQSNMNFASISARSGGKVILDPNDTRSSSGGVELEEEQGVSAAKFLISGEEGLTVAVSLPQDHYMLSNGMQNISLHSFTSNLPQSFQLNNNSIALKVGATIEIEGPKSPGEYRSIQPMAVTVNYN